MSNIWEEEEEEDSKGRFELKCLMAYILCATHITSKHTNGSNVVVAFKRKKEVNNKRRRQEKEQND